MGSTIQQLSKLLIIYVCAVHLCCYNYHHPILLSGDKATVQFQDNVEHTVLLKDIRPQKVCITNRKITILLFHCRNRISSLSGQSYNKKLKNVRTDILPWQENQEPRKGPMQSLTLPVRAPSNQALPARSLNLKVMMEKQRSHLL